MNPLLSFFYLVKNALDDFESPIGKAMFAIIVLGIVLWILASFLVFAGMIAVELGVLK